MSDQRQRPRGVVDGVLYSTSPTGISRADPGSDGGCARKWYLREVDKLPEKPPSRRKIYGDEGHQIIKAYYAGGARPDRSDIVRGMHRLPEPGPDLIVERFIDTELEGVTVTTRMDLVHARGSHDDVGTPDPPGTVEVKDWKFVGTRQHIPAPEAVPHELQMALYGDYWHRRGVPLVRLTLENFVERPAGVLPVSFLAAPSHVAPAINRARQTIRQMILNARAPTWRDVKPNPSACRAYGGCDYAGAPCPVPDFDPLQQLFGEERAMSVLSDMKARRAAQAASSGPATTAVSAEEAAAQAARERRDALGEDLIAAIDFLRSNKTGYPPMVGRAAQAWAAERLTTCDPERGYQGAGEFASLDPVESTADLIAIALEISDEQKQTGGEPPYGGSPLAETDEAKLARLERERLAAARSHPASVLPPDAPVSNPAAHVDAAEAKSKKAKEKTEASRAAADGVEPEAKKSKPAKTGKGSIVLVLVDCDQVSGEGAGQHQRLEPYCYDLLAMVARAAELPDGADPRVVGKNEEVGFGKWRGLIETAAIASPPGSGTWLLDSRGGELPEAVISGLVRAGVTVIRGHR